MSLSRIILGLLRKPNNGYDLGAYFNESLNHFWPADISQIYRELKRLEAEGLAMSKTEPSSIGPDRRVYKITRRGERALLDWLNCEPHFGDERYTYLAQLFFMGEWRDLERTARFIKQLRDAFNARLEMFRKVEREWLDGDPRYPDCESDDGFHAFLTLKLGIFRAEAGLKWCDDASERIEKLAASRKKVLRGDAKNGKGNV